ncbi:MAG: ABC transporter permease, partial [Dehalococcoidia bacterium]
MRRRIVIIVFLIACIGLTVWITEMPAERFITQKYDWDKVLNCAMGHIKLVLISEAIAIAIAVPLGILITREGFTMLSTPVIGLGNIGQAMPSLALLGIIFVIFLTAGTKTVIVALFIYGLLPILRNTYTSIKNVDPAVIEAARGMGMSKGRIARNVELPIALPVIMTGIRVSTIIIVGTAELAPLVGGSSLGDITIAGAITREPLIVLQ